jgi:hypothetical protein
MVLRHLLSGFLCIAVSLQSAGSVAYIFTVPPDEGFTDVICTSGVGWKKGPAELPSFDLAGNSAATHTLQDSDLFFAVGKQPSYAQHPEVSISRAVPEAFVSARNDSHLIRGPPLTAA